MMAIADPSGRHPARLAPPVLVSEGHAPVVAVLLASAKADERIVDPQDALSGFSAARPVASASGT
jgi:hypothetical protein